MDLSARGIVVAKDPVNISDAYHYRLTIRFDSNSTDIVLDSQNVWLLPNQGDENGKYT